jgi:hypothetical protein
MRVIEQLLWAMVEAPDGSLVRFNSELTAWELYEASGIDRWDIKLNDLCSLEVVQRNKPDDTYIADYGELMVERAVKQYGCKVLKKQYRSKRLRKDTVH